jgi:hypothetical protein
MDGRRICRPHYVRARAKTKRPATPIPKSRQSGGEPLGNSQGSGVKLKAEFSGRPHVRGAVSRVRSPSPDSGDGRRAVAAAVLGCRALSSRWPSGRGGHAEKRHLAQSSRTSPRLFPLTRRSTSGMREVTALVIQLRERVPRNTIAALMTANNATPSRAYCNQITNT